MSDPENDICINGPKLAAWLRHGNRLPLDYGREKGKTCHDPVCHLHSRVRKWAEGEQAKIESVDKWLTFIGCHISELPDDFWEEPKSRGAARRFSEVEKRRAVQLLRDGLSPTEIAKGLGCSPKSVRLWERAAA